MQAAGEIVGRALQAVRDAAAVGVSTLELDAVAEQTIRDAGAIPTFKGYGGFPGSICASVNDVIVHGIPGSDIVLAEGDLVSIDCGATLDGWVGDSAWTFGVGKLSTQAQALSDATESSPVPSSCASSCGSTTVSMNLCTCGGSTGIMDSP